jgi:hypothetical protein
MCDENRPLRGSLTLNDVYNEDDAHNLKSHTLYVKKWIEQKKVKKTCLQNMTQNLKKLYNEVYV